MENTGAPEPKRRVYLRAFWGRSTWLFLAVFFLSLVFLFGILALLVKAPPQTIVRGVSIGPFDVGGLTYGQAQKMLLAQTDSLESHGINFVYNGVSSNLGAVAHSPTNPDLSVMVFDYDVEGTVKEAAGLGREGKEWQSFWARLMLRLFGQKVAVQYNIDELQARAFLQEKFAQWEKPMRNAGLETVWPDKTVKVITETAGEQFDYDAMIKELKNNLANLNPAEINLRLKQTKPEISTADVEALKADYATLLGRGSIVLNSKDKKFIVPTAEWLSWVVLEKNKNKNSLAISRPLVGEYIKKVVASEVETTYQEAKFVMEGGKVTEFKPGQAGLTIDLDKLTADLAQTLFAGPAADGTEIGLQLQETIPPTAVANINDIGIKEIIGIGRSNFSNSPTNRRHNIKVGADSLHGLLIAPGETFSLINALGPVDGEHGYLPELVIKGNKTTPEFGGGLCQIGTTMFRAALASGLPIVERQSHSYRVVYYEPAGTDATIYDPRPDLKFLNDSAHHVLIQAKLEKNDIAFQFWGTLDERKVEQTKPIVYNIKSPPEARLIETLDMPVGTKKCTEKAHAGADAIFTYIVTYLSGEIKTQEFKSHYRPWGEVCLIGVEKLSVPVDDETVASSTPINP